MLLSDGKNTFTDTDYTSYGYLADGRLGAVERAAHPAQLNDKVSTLCEAVKAKGIRLYMILLEENDAGHEADLRGLRLAERQGRAALLRGPRRLDARRQAFADIGQDLTTIHITR